MQRSTNTTSPTTRTPETATPPQNKRQRLSNGSYNRTPASAASEELAPSQSPNADDWTYSSAGQGETKWYLKIAEPKRHQSTESPLRIVSAGFSTLDRNATKDANEYSDKQDDTEGVATRRVVSGRRSFGKFNKTLEVRTREHAR